MECYQRQGIECSFDWQRARRDLKSYRKNGPAKSTRVLLDVLKSAGVEGKTLLDVGGGIGAIQHELVAADADCVVSVEAASAYVDLAQTEAVDALVRGQGLRQRFFRCVGVWQVLIYER